MFRVASGVWLEGKNLFILATDEDQQQVKNSSALALMPVRFLQPSSQHQLLHAIRRSTVSDSELVMIAPYGLSSEPLLADQIVPIFVIAVPVATKPSD